MDVTQLIGINQHLVQAGLEASYGIEAVSYETFPVQAPTSNLESEFKADESINRRSGELASTPTNIHHTHEFKMYNCPMGALTEPSVSKFLQGSRFIKSTVKVFRIETVTGVFTPGEMCINEGTDDVGHVIAFLPDTGDATKGYLFVNNSLVTPVVSDVLTETVGSGSGTITAVKNAVLYGFTDEEALQKSMSVKHNDNGHLYHSLGVKFKASGEFMVNAIPTLTFSGKGKANAHSDTAMTPAPLVCSSNPAVIGARTFFNNIDMSTLTVLDSFTFDTTGDATPIPDGHTPITGIAGFTNAKATFTAKMSYGKVAFADFDPLNQIINGNTKFPYQFHHNFYEGDLISVFLPSCHMGGNAAKKEAAEKQFWDLSVNVGPHCSDNLAQIYLCYWAI